jgi:nitrogen fixation protein FixH
MSISRKTTMTASSLPVDPRQEARSRRIALTILGVFAAVVLLVNGFMIATAVRTWTGLAVDGAYERGLAYNQTLDEARAQAERGWQSEIGFTSTAPLAGTLSFRLADASGRPIHGAEVEAVMFRPTQGGSDFRVGLVGVGDGTYRMKVSFPEVGVWDAYLVARTAQGPYHRRERLLVR